MPLSDEVNAIRNELAAVKTELLAQDASIKALQSALEAQKTSIGAIDKQDDDRWLFSRRALLKSLSSLSRRLLEARLGMRAVTRFPHW